jgi:hypothetical protein
MPGRLKQSIYFVAAHFIMLKNNQSLQGGSASAICRKTAIQAACRSR